MMASVLTPIGPGHERLAKEAMGSVDLAAVFPGLRVFSLTKDDTQGLLGRSKARNLLMKAAAQCEVDWVFWLDADDIMAPEAFLALQRALVRWPTMDALWGKIVCQTPGGEPKERPAQNYPESYEDLAAMEPTSTLQSGFFCRASVALKEPWNEDMDAGEDFELYLRLWKNYECHKTTENLMVNRRKMSSQGPRSATPGEWRTAVDQLLRAKKKPFWRRPR